MPGHDGPILGLDGSVIMGTPYETLGSRAIKGIFYEAVDKLLDGAWFGDVTLRTSSDQASEDYAMVGAPPQMRERTGHNTEAQVIPYSFNLKNLDLETGIGIPWNDLRRDKTGMLRVRMSQLAEKAVKWVSDNLTTLLNDGATNTLSWTGQAFYSATQQWGNSGAFKNLLTSSEVPALNVSTTTNPTPTEMANIILGMIAYQYKYLDDTGDDINGMAREFAVLVPPEYMAAAIAGVYSERLDGGISNSLLTAQSKRGFRITPYVLPKLTAGYVHVHRVDGGWKSLIWQEEVPVTMDVLDVGSEYFIQNQKVWAGVRANQNVGYGSPLCASRGTLS